MTTEDQELSGRQTRVTVPENVNAIHSMILDDGKISTKKIAETLAIHVLTCKMHGNLIFSLRLPHRTFS
jgi:hypothetical protein